MRIFLYGGEIGRTCGYCFSQFRHVTDIDTVVSSCFGIRFSATENDWRAKIYWIKCCSFFRILIITIIFSKEIKLSYIYQTDLARKESYLLLNKTLAY